MNNTNIGSPNAGGTIQSLQIERGPGVSDTSNNIFVPGSMRFAAINRQPNIQNGS